MPHMKFFSVSLKKNNKVTSIRKGKLKEELYYISTQPPFTPFECLVFFFFWKTTSSRNGEQELQGLCYRRCRLYRIFPCEEAFAEGLHSPCNTQELAYILSLSSSLPISLSIPLFLSADLQWWIADDHAKVGLLQSLPNADTRLRLFKADIYNPDEFEQAIQGCEFVFHVATPLQHIEDSQVCPNFPSFSSTYTYI